MCARRFGAGTCLQETGAILQRSIVLSAAVWIGLGALQGPECTLQPAGGGGLCKLQILQNLVILDFRGLCLLQWTLQ